MRSSAARPAGTAVKSNSHQVRSRQRIFVLVGVVWAIAGALVLTLDPWAIAAAGAVAIGLSHLVGRCGISHFGALTPCSKLPGQRGRWLSNTVAYVVAGALSSMAVGASLAALGELLLPSRLRTAALASILVLAGVAAASELRLTRWRVPQPNLQTRREWGLLRPPIPAIMWGFSLGLTFATVFTFAGTWLVLALPIAVGEPLFGATILLAHWLGRAAPILVGPVLLDDAAHSLDLLEEIEGAEDKFRRSNILGVGLMALSLVITLRDEIAW